MVNYNYSIIYFSWFLFQNHLGISPNYSTFNKILISKGGHIITNIINNDKIFVPTNDYVFKRIFGHVGNEDITKSFINSILDKKVTKINLNENPILDKDLKDDKVGILDIKAVLNNNIQCDIEMQVVKYSNISKRILYYWSKLFSSQIIEGNNYNSLNKSIVIFFNRRFWTWYYKRYS